MIEQDLGTRVALDDEFHFARIRFQNGEIVTASFSEAQFSKLRNQRGEITVAGMAHVFAEGPTVYNTSDRIAARVTMDQEAVTAALAAYGREVTAYVEGRCADRPAYPDLAALPHWKDDFKLAAFSGPGEVGIPHIFIDLSDLTPPRTATSKADFAWLPAPAASGTRSIFGDIKREFRDAVAAFRQKEQPDILEIAVLAFAAAGVVLAKRIRDGLFAPEPAAVRTPIRAATPRARDPA